VTVTASSGASEFRMMMKIPASCLPLRLGWAGWRMALTFPFLPPPQKNRSPPSDSSPETPTLGGSSSFSQDLSCLRIDSPHIALVTFPGAVPALTIDPSHAGDEAVGLDRGKNCP
jgi:hypothetical protein